MFESLVEVRRESILARKAWTLPLAFGFHASVIAAIFFYSLFARDILIPPSAVFLPSPVDIIPIQIGGFTKERPAEEARKAEPPRQDPERITEPEVEQVELAQGQTGRSDRTFEDTTGPFGGPTGPGDPNGAPGGRPPDRPDDNAIKPVQPREVIHEGGLVSALRTLRQTPPAYPQAFSSLGVSGRVELEIIVDERGKVEKVTVISATNSAFADAAVAAARGWLFHPPISRGGASVAVSKRIVVNFSPR